MIVKTVLLVSALAAEAAPSETAPAPPPVATPTSSPAPGKAPVRARQAARRTAAPVASLPTVAGELLEIDHRAHRLRLRTAAGELVLTFDRNTQVLAPGGSATPVQLTTGTRIRAGREGEARAAWVEIEAPASTPGASP